MKKNNIMNNFSKGFIIGIGFFLAIILGGVSIVLAQSLVAQPGDKLTAQNWNSLVNKVENSLSFLAQETINGGSSDEVISQTFTIPEGKEAVLQVSTNTTGRGNGSSSNSLLNDIIIQKNGVQTICSRDRHLNTTSGSNYVVFVNNSCNLLLDSGEYNVISKNGRTNILTGSDYENKLSYSVFLK